MSAPTSKFNASVELLLIMAKKLQIMELWCLPL